MSVVVVTTFVYLLVAFALVILVIPQWQSSGQEYLEHVFSTPERAEAVNRLLVTGLSLITLSLALFIVGIGSPNSSTEAVMSLFVRLGVLMAIVGVAYLANLGAYWYLGNRIGEERAAEHPAGPDAAAVDRPADPAAHPETGTRAPVDDVGPTDFSDLDPTKPEVQP